LNLRADCVVVGGGPAGSVSALLLARCGFDVILLDRVRFPRAKACGDCISPQTNLLLEELGLMDAVAWARPARLEGWRIFSPSGRSFACEFRAATTDPRLQYGLAIERERLDAILLEAARDAGVRVLTETKVDDLMRSNGQVTGVRARSRRAGPLAIAARLTIGADGLRSVVRRRLQLSARTPNLHKVALTTHLHGVAGLDQFGELHLGTGACVGIAPVDTQSLACNLTLVVDANRHGRTLAGKSAGAFANWLQLMPGVRGRIPEPENPQAWTLLAAGPFDWPTHGVVTRGAALVGDAAGYYDPFTGQGIYQAIAGAFALARAAESAFSRAGPAEPLHAYARAHRRIVGHARNVQRAIEAVCARPQLAERCVAALAHSPPTAAALIAVTGDLWPPHRLLSPSTAFSFLLGLTRSSA
jgi:flavin-dependent dehydrogenase